MTDKDAAARDKSRAAGKDKGGAPCGEERPEREDHATILSKINDQPRADEEGERGNEEKKPRAVLGEINGPKDEGAKADGRGEPEKS